ncbi:MAG: hypothetical protein E7242_01765 [Lachnospiraceae bacterium]|nr:hypothetical protein [Lachnospiraceae bacterium]
MEKTNKKKLFRILIIVAIVIIALLIAVSVFCKRPKSRLLLSVLDFKNNTMQKNDFLAYDVDLMELCREYFNSDVEIKGEMGLNDIKKLNASVFSDISAKRSFDQKRLSADVGLNLLVFEAGNIEFYAENSSLYMDAPILGNSSYSFDSVINFFPKMPNLTDNPDSKWYSDNLWNIIQLIREMDVEALESDYTDAEGVKCDAFKSTIHKGSGHFIWELLDMEDPDFDIAFTAYLTPSNKLRKIEVDLSPILPGAYVVLEGCDMEKVNFSYELPDNEKATLIVQRSNEYKNYLDCKLIYYTNADAVYSLESALEWENHDNGFDLYIKNLSLRKDNSLLCTGYFKGDVMKSSFSEDVFEGKDEYLYGFEKIDWKAIRNDVDGFVKEILNKMSIGEIFGG